MGKKNKKIEIRLSDEELQSSTIGYLEEEKKGPLGLIVLFAIFIAFAIFLPNITEYVNKLMGKDNQNIVKPIANPNEEENPDEIEEIKMYDFAEDLAFEYNGINFSNFKIFQSENKYYISFVLTNNSNKYFDFSENKYFLETYSEDKTLLERHIFNNNVLNNKSNITQILEINSDEYNRVKKIVISNKNDSDYPEVSLELNNKEQYILTCSKPKNIIIYTFDKDNNLTTINDSLNYDNDYSDTYKSTLISYQNQVANYNNKNGISASLVEISTGFTVRVDINVNNADLNNLYNDNYYNYKTSPKIVKFEMESRGYSCK